LEQETDYVLLLNQDTEVEPDFLERLVETAKKNPRAGLLSPLIFWKKTREVWFSGKRICWLTMKSCHKKKIWREDPYVSNFITGCSMLIKKEVFQKIGLLDERYFLYWEDADFSLRAKKAGFLGLVDPKSIVYHFESSEPTKGDKLYYLVFSGLKFFKKNTPFWVKPWIDFYYKLRKLKNWTDLKFFPSDNARIVRKAYDDFEKRRT
jgi:hypothetical protein